MTYIKYLAIKFGALFLVLIIVSCKNNSEDRGLKEDINPVLVEVSLPNTMNEGSTINLSGKVSAVNTAILSTRMMGHVDKIYVSSGDKVKEGQLLLRINNLDLSAKLAQAKAGVTEAQVAYSNAKKDMDRYSFLYQEQSASQKELDDVETQYAMAKARLEAAKQAKSQVAAQFSYSDLRAPFSGVISNKFINEGDMANPGVPLLEIEAPGNYEVQTMASESQITEVKQGMEVEVLIKALDEIVQGKVIEISTSSKNTGGQFQIKVLLDLTSQPILSGMYTTVKIPTTSENKGAIALIPKNAIISKGELKGVYTVSDQNTVVLRWLRLGQVYGDEIEVLTGLKPSEQIVISAEGILKNGTKIALKQ